MAAIRAVNALNRTGHLPICVPGGAWRRSGRVYPAICPTSKQRGLRPGILRRCRTFQGPSDQSRPRLDPISSRTTRRSRCGRARRWPPTRHVALNTPPRRRAAGPLSAHPVLPEALPFLLLPRLHRQERASRSSSTSTCVVREWELYAQTPALSERRAEFRLFRRRHAVVPVHDAAPGTRRRD